MTARHRKAPASGRAFGTLAAVLAALVGVVVLWRTGEQGRSTAQAASPQPAVTASVPAGFPPSRTSSPSPAAPERGTLLIHGTGDVSLDPSYISSYRTHGYGYAWSGLGGLFRRDDLTVVNLECSVSTLGTAVPKEFNFRGDPAALPAMRKAGVEVANLGNNHSYDFGPDALLDSVRNLREAGIAPVGAGADQAAALKPARFELNGWRVAVVGFDMVVDPYPEAVATAGEPGTAAGHDTGLMVRTVRRVSRHADVTVVVIHWGVELDTRPRADQVALGHRLIDAGADVIFGHHSHRLQPMETYRGRPIFWSLGNFVWPNLSVAGSTTAIAEVAVSPKGRFRGRLLPAYIVAPGHPQLGG